MQIQVPGVGFKLPKPVKAAEDSLRAEAETFNKNESAVAEELAQWKETDGAEVTRESLDAGAAIARKQTDLLIQELELRTKLDSHLARLERELSSFREESWKAYETAEAETKAALLSIGYVEGLIPGGLHNCITPLLIHSHPKVFAAKNAYAEIDIRMYDGARQVNDSRIQAIETSLEACQRRALSPK